MLQSLEKSKTRKNLGITAIEGEKEIEMAMSAHLDLQTVFFLNEIVNSVFLKKIEVQYPNIEFLSLSKDLFAKISYRETTGGLIAIAKTKHIQLENLVLPENPLILVVEGVEKPGNLGAILRTADAAKIDAVICCEMPTDLYNPNTIRASLGTVFTVPIVISNNHSTMEWLKTNKIQTFCTNLHHAKSYHLQDYKRACAFVLGTEATGVSDDWINFSDTNIKIPMLGKIDSMNVSVAAAIIIFEAKRQRSFL
ncbi:MAG: RNA methyltransferase [bacterium]|nr:RNA methyltransferase [bacterium]